MTHFTYYFAEYLKRHPLVFGIFTGQAIVGVVFSITDWITMIKEW